MTKKDFKAIADIINLHYKKDYHSFIELEKDLVVYFKSVNPNFNREKFKEACFGESH